MKLSMPQASQFGMFADHARFYRNTKKQIKNI